MRCQQPLDHGGQPGDFGVDPVDALQHRLQQAGVRTGEELRTFQRFPQLGDLAAGAGAGQFGQRLGVALAGDQLVHDVPAGDPVQIGDHGGQLDRRRFQQFLHALLLAGALVGQVAAVAGVQPDDAELLGGHKAGGDRAALKARRQPGCV
jgi:hypothetical protein